MDKKPDIGFEYDYIRIVYEVITLKLRTNKKIIEKEINYIGNKLLGIKKKPGSISENMQLIKTLIAKTENLQKKYDEICKEEEFMYNCLNERLNQLQLIDDNNYNFENLKSYFTKKMNHLLLDFFLREKFLDTAKYFIEEEKINNSVEYSIFIEIQKILENLHRKDITDALKWCTTNKNKLSKLNSNIEFKLLKQQFIEIYKKGNNLETVKFARENFANFSNYDEIKEIMLLLAIKPDLVNKIQRISDLLSDDRWGDLENEFKQNFFQVYSMKTNSPLEVLFQSGLMGLKTKFCYSNRNKNTSCPVCCEEIGKFAQVLPSSDHPVSALICRVTGEIMDHTNPPMALTNGQVFSEKALCENCKNNSGKVVCPITGIENRFDQCKKVFYI